MPTLESPVLGQQWARSRGGNSVAPKGQSICHINSREDKAWLHIITASGLFLKWVLVERTCTQSRSQCHSNESRRTLLRREVGPSANSQLVITHRETVQSKSEEMKWATRAPLHATQECYSPVNSSCHKRASNPAQRALQRKDSRPNDGEKVQSGFFKDSVNPTFTFQAFSWCFNEDPQ